jgi:hypothetical protein
MARGSVLVVVVALLLAVAMSAALTVTWARRSQRLHREAFDATNDILSASGAAAVEDTCTIDLANKKQYSMRGYLHLGRHPSDDNACVFRRDEYDENVMDKQLDACKEGGFLSKADIVENVGAEEVGGVKACVVKFKSGLSSMFYDAYAVGARVATTKRTTLYKELHDEFERNQVELTRLLDEIPLKRSELRRIQTKRKDLKASMLALTKEAQIAAESQRIVTTEMDNLSSHVSARQSTIESLQAQLATATQDVASAAQQAGEAAAARDKPPPQRLDVNKTCDVAMWADRPVYALGSRGMAPWGPVTSISGGGAQWIWSTPDAATNADGATVLFQAEVVVAAEPYAAALYVVVDNTATVYLDALQLGTAENGWDWTGKAARFDMQMPVGKSLITIVARNAGGPAGLLAMMVNRDTERETLATNPHSWRCTSQNVQPPRCP